MIRTILAALALFTLSAPAYAADLSGAWGGSYSYDGESQPSVAFKAKLRFEDDAFTGSTREPNTFGDPSAKQLRAKLIGIIGPSGAVNFTKTYDGSGGVNHSVEYAGYLDAEGRCISGSWHIGETGGSFHMCRGARLVS
jgi:hypothetical protein